jgi:putative aldouronate transport system permease protein
MKRHFTFGQFCIAALVLLFTLACFLPMLLTLIVSFTDESAINAHGYSFFPSKLSVYAYQVILQGKLSGNNTNVVASFLLACEVTLLGTLIAVLITAMAGYSLSNKNMRYRNAFALLFFITMIFYAGIVPWYLMCSQLGLKNNFLALVIPSLLFNPFNLFLTRNFMESVPDSLRESASLDGAGDVYIAFRIYFPLCKPVLATITLFYGLAYWNDWWNAIMLVDDKRLYPLQYFLFSMQSNIQMLRDMQNITGGGGSSNLTLPAESMKMATSIITIGPILLLYPYLQKYFVKGLVVGSVKG